MSGRDFGSLTKEPPLRDLDRTIEAIRPDMPYSDLLEIARRITHSTAPGLIRQRFLLVRRDNTIAYDHFLSLVAAHGVASPLVRKVMYFLWSYRDLRLRRFICERVAAENGKWRPDELSRISNAEFFAEEGWLSPDPARKARSNIEFFLTSTGIYDATKRQVRLDLSDGWLDEAAKAAAQHEDDVFARRMLLDNTASFLVSRQWNGLLNASPAELLSIGPNPPSDSDPLEDDTIDDFTPSPGKEWKRREPKPTDKTSTNAYIDLVARERANKSHYQLEQLTAELARNLGYVPKSNEHIDMYFKTPKGTVLTEIKSCDDGNFHSQLRKGIAQLLEYRFLYGRVLGEKPTLVLIVETRPPREKLWLVDFLQSLSVVVAWRDPTTPRLVSGQSPLPVTLKGVIQPLA